MGANFRRVGAPYVFGRARIDVMRHRNAVMTVNDFDGMNHVDDLRVIIVLIDHLRRIIDGLRRAIRAMVV